MLQYYSITEECLRSLPLPDFNPYGELPLLRPPPSIPPLLRCSVRTVVRVEEDNSK
jgi:hypothetical protein